MAAHMCAARTPVVYVRRPPDTRRGTSPPVWNPREARIRGPFAFDRGVVAAEGGADCQSAKAVTPASQSVTSTTQPAAYGSFGTKPVIRASGFSRSSTPAVMPRCNVQIAGWFSLTASR
jgi:hypothetical protein